MTKILILIAVLFMYLLILSNMSTNERDARDSWEERRRKERREGKNRKNKRLKAKRKFYDSTVIEEKLHCISQYSDNIIDLGNRRAGHKIFSDEEVTHELRDELLELKEMCKIVKRKCKDGEHDIELKTVNKEIEKIETALKRLERFERIR